MPDLPGTFTMEECESCEVSSAGGEAAGAIRRALKECIRLALQTEEVCVRQFRT
jgi:hypothetical protein